MSRFPVPALPVAARRGVAVEAGIRELGDGLPLVGWFRLSGGKHRGALGHSEGETIRRLVDTSLAAGVPIVGVLSTSGADVHEGVAALHGWGTVAHSLARASGVIPIALALVGPCVGGPALLLGMADVVVMGRDAFAYLSGPQAVERFTGMAVSRESLGGSAVHASRTGVAALVASDEEDALLAVADILSYLPPNNVAALPVTPCHDPPDRACGRAAATVPPSATASYDVRDVIDDVVDADTFLELRALWAPNLVTGLARLGGRPVGVIANQPCQLAGTLDIDAAQKGARFVQWCDSFGVPLLSFVDTPGFQPGKDIEWRGMIRHGAQLVHAYAAATVPRLCVVLRKAYGGAYIVMDSKTLGNDVCLAWPAAELAVMGPSGAVQVLHRKRLAALPEGEESERERKVLEAEYVERYCSPVAAAERGYVDDIVDPADTRRILTSALAALAAKRDDAPARRHANTPL